MKTTMLMTVVMVAATQVLAAQSDLTKQYEAARKQIEAGEVVSYSNGLVVIAGQLKKAGDLDNYLSVQAEQKRLVQDAQVAPGLTNGCRVVAEAAQKVLADQNARLMTLLKAYIGKLGESVKALMQADRIDEAKAAKDAMGAAQFELAELEAKMPKVEEAPKTNGMAAAENAGEPKKHPIEGTWEYKAEGDTWYRDFANGTVTVRKRGQVVWTGTYEITGTNEVVTTGGGSSQVHRIRKDGRLDIAGGYSAKRVSKP